ncbi:MAG: hypothetical protein EOO45_23155 [Flavobacterium sp.]|nr:MAG: hypothetical protein EOO45_23155 [Flavobacterium sp.]
MKKQLNGLLKLITSLFRLFFIGLPCGLLSAGITTILLMHLERSTSFDPFNDSAGIKDWIESAILVLALLGGGIGFYLDHRLRSGIERRAIRTAYGWITAVLGLYFAFAFSEVLHSLSSTWHDSDKRLVKVVKLHGKTEDMCQVLKLGMHEATVKALMGPPPSALNKAEEVPPKELMYCPKTNACRDVTLDAAGHVTKIQCWNGKNISSSPSGDLDSSP